MMFFIIKKKYNLNIENMDEKSLKKLDENY
jgi:hypothetical protein